MQRPKNLIHEFPPKKINIAFLDLELEQKLTQVILFAL